MKPTLLFATLSMVFAAPSTFAKSELETLRSRCSEQERQIRQLEDENTKLRSPGSQTGRISAAKPAAAAAVAKPNVTDPSATTYTVKAGDCLEKIARKVGAAPEKLAKSNGLTTNSIIRPGQKLKVPGTAAAAASPAAPAVTAATSPSPKSTGKTHKVQAGETFSSISKKHGMTPEALGAANPTVKPASLRPGQVVSLGGDGPSARTITAPASHAKATAPAEKASAPAPAVKSPAAAKAAETPPAPATAKQPVAETETHSPKPEKKIRPVTIEGEMTYGEFATKHGTDAERLNALNGLDLTTATVLAKGSELYVPAQP